MNVDNKSLGINYDGPLPPLPDPLPPFPEPIPPQPVPHPQPFPEQPQPYPWPFPHQLRSLRCGCYLLKLTSSFNRLSVADGTLRVECHSNGRTASGDLYSRRIIQICLPRKPGLPNQCTPFLTPGPKPTDGIPILPRDLYRYYLRVTKILEWFTFTKSFTLEFEMFRFDKNTKTWKNEGAYTAQMSWTTAPDSYPSSGDYLEGDVKNNGGKVVGRLTMGWVSEYLRRAVVEIDRVSASEAPLNNGNSVTWRSIFKEVGWDLDVIESHTNVTEPSGEGWSMAELHQGMLDWRDSANLDKEWRYHLMCVRQLDYTTRGVMFDSYGSDANNVPREGAAIASHWVFPKKVNPSSTDPDEKIDWDNCKGVRFGTATGPYFRTAVHEIGHAIMMFHPSSTTGNHIMQVTPTIAANALPPAQFPNNIDWSFSTEDQRRLRHLPDVVVRPGSVLAFGTDVGSSYAGIPLSPLDVTIDIEGLEVEVTPLLEVVPLGAPVRVNFQLMNKGNDSVLVPGRIGMKSGNISGEVIDPAGNIKAFATIVRYLDEDGKQSLEPSQSIGDSLTLLRGCQGPLFASSGVHRVIVRVTWYVDGCPVTLSGETSVMVSPPENEKHAKVALKVFTTPDALVALVIGGDHVTEGIEAITTAMKDPVLKPHYAYIEAKRLSQRFGKRKADLNKAAKFITDAAVMSPAEIKKAASLIKAEKGKSAAKESIAKTLKSKAKILDVSDEIKKVLDSL